MEPGPRAKASTISRAVLTLGAGTVDRGHSGHCWILAAVAWPLLARGWCAGRWGGSCKAFKMPGWLFISSQLLALGPIQSVLDQGHLFVEFKQPVAVTASWTLHEFVIRGACPRRTSARNWRLQACLCPAARTTGSPSTRLPPSALPASGQAMGSRMSTKTPPASPAWHPGALP